MAKKFRLRYVSGTQAIDPHLAEIEKLGNREDMVAGLVSGAASFIPVVGPALSPLLGAAAKKIQGAFNSGQVEDLELKSRRLGEFQTAQGAITSDPTEIQVSAFEIGTSFVKGETKDIEVEKDELMFRKIGGKWKLIADFNGGKTHEAGGEDVTAQEGDIIFPGAKRDKLVKLLDSNGVISKENEPQFETERFKLPVDKDKDKAASGLEIANTIGTSLPAAFNLIKGAGKAELEQRRFVEPDKLKFVDTSQVSKNELREQFQSDIQSISNVSGGSAGTLLSNVGAAGNRFQRSLSDINAQTATGKQNIENANVQISNEADRINTNLAIGFDEKDAANRAARSEFIGAGLTQVGEITQQGVFNQNLKARDEKQSNLNALMLSLMGSSNFEVGFTSQQAKDAVNTGDFSDISELISFRGEAASGQDFVPKPISKRNFNIDAPSESFSGIPGANRKQIGAIPANPFIDEGSINNEQHLERIRKKGSPNSPFRLNGFI